ncbi:MAG TPA: lytic transglycosylase domain-containing protein [Bacteroidales bacterium]|nr:lytic transglycosylase domain-containing protein [Bacteroidales bacterium]
MATSPSIGKEMETFIKEFTKSFATAATKEMLKFKKDIDKTAGMVKGKNVVGGGEGAGTATDRYLKKIHKDILKLYKTDKVEKTKIENKDRKEKRKKDETADEKKRKAELERYYRALRKSMSMREKVERWLLQRFWGRTFLKAWYGFWNLKVLSTIRDGIQRITGFFESQLHDILGDMAPLFDLAKDTFIFAKNTVMGIGEALWKTAKGIWALAPVKRFFEDIGKKFKDFIFSPFQKFFSSIKKSFFTKFYTLFKQPWMSGKARAELWRQEKKEAIKKWAEEKKNALKHWAYQKALAAKYWLWEKTKGGLGKIISPFKKSAQAIKGGISLMKWAFPLFISAIAGLVSGMMSLLAPLLLPVALGLLAISGASLIKVLIDDPAFKKDWEIFTNWIVEKFKNLFDLVMKAVKEKGVEYGLNIASFGLAVPYRETTKRILKAYEEREKIKREAAETEELKRIKKDPEYRKKVLEEIRKKNAIQDPKLDEYITTIAKRYEIPEEIFRALIQQESAGGRRNLSKKGAIGMTQLMPKTAKDLDVNPYDPYQNIEGGARYLKQMFNIFGSWEKALAAYNAGAKRVREYGGIPPYPETQKYVERIKNMAGMAEGGKITGGPSMPGAGIDSKLIRASVGEWITPKRTAGMLNSILPGGMAALIRDPIGTLMRFASNFTFGGLSAGTLMGFQRGGRVSLTRRELSAPVKGVTGAGLRNLENQEMMLNKLTAALTSGGQREPVALPVPVGMSSATVNTSPINMMGNIGQGSQPTDPLPTLMSTPVAWYIVLQNTI